MPTDTTVARDRASLLRAILNLSQSHREHEKFYASSPRELAVTLQRHARTLQALADRWSTSVPSTTRPFSPYEGAEDLNDPAALQLDGVLFMEGEGAPTEITHLIRDLRAAAKDSLDTGEWLEQAMRASWDLAAALIDIDELADVLGERHRIIVNDWHAALMNTLIGRLLLRAVEILEHVEFTPASIRRDLAGPRLIPSQLYSAAELIGHAADLLSDSAGLVHDNERRWRTFRQRVLAAVAPPSATLAGAPCTWPAAADALVGRQRRDQTHCREGRDLRP
jgi:hypothetical protein